MQVLPVPAKNHLWAVHQEFYLGVHHQHEHLSQGSTHCNSLIDDWKIISGNLLPTGIYNYPILSVKMKIYYNLHNTSVHVKMNMKWKLHENHVKMIFITRAFLYLYKYKFINKYIKDNLVWLNTID